LVVIRLAALIKRRILSELDRKPEAFEEIARIAIEPRLEDLLLERIGDEPALGEHDDVLIEVLDSAPALIDLAQEVLLPFSVAAEFDAIRQSACCGRDLLIDERLEIFFGEPRQVGWRDPVARQEVVITLQRQSCFPHFIGIESVEQLARYLPRLGVDRLT